MLSSPNAKLHESLLRLPLTPPDFPDGLDRENDETLWAIASHVIRTERDALTHLHDLYLSDQTAQRSFAQAVNGIAKRSRQGGRVIVSGVGKSGKIGQKFVATLNSFGISSAFLHPTEALHGDLGMIGSNDTIVILTYSGRTPEIRSMLEFVPSDRPLVAITSCKEYSSCPLFAHRKPSNSILLSAPVLCSEMESFGVPAPTSSTTVALTLTDALALAIVHRLHPSPLAVFHEYHPGGSIGASANRTSPRLMGEAAINVAEILIITPRSAVEAPTVLDALLTAARSVSGWIRPSSDMVMAPRQMQRIGRTVDLSQPLHLLDAGAVREKGDWISVPAANTVRETRDWIVHMRQSERGRTFLNKGTVLGIVDSEQLVSGVVEIEDIVEESELLDY
ncbi:MAG: hypothetical protein LQ350_004486 [Teloschistes chrysophthalmus]|nr:MAG: hypothetical protein LQ350_004486 [Niorma chrysophthalma]